MRSCVFAVIFISHHFLSTWVYNLAEAACALPNPITVSTDDLLGTLNCTAKFPGSIDDQDCSLQGHIQLQPAPPTTLLSGWLTIVGEADGCSCNGAPDITGDAGVSPEPSTPPSVLRTSPCYQGPSTVDLNALSADTPAFSLSPSARLTLRNVRILGARLPESLPLDASSFLALLAVRLAEIDSWVAAVQVPNTSAADAFAAATAGESNNTAGCRGCDSPPAPDAAGNPTPLSPPPPPLQLVGCEVVASSCAALAAHKAFACGLSPSPNFTVTPTALVVHLFTTSAVAAINVTLTCSGGNAATWPLPCLASVAATGQELRQAIQSLLGQTAALATALPQPLPPTAAIFLTRDMRLYDNVNGVAADDVIQVFGGAVLHIAGAAGGATVLDLSGSAGLVSMAGSISKPYGLVRLSNLTLRNLPEGPEDQLPAALLLTPMWTFSMRRSVLGSRKETLLEVVDATVLDVPRTELAMLYTVLGDDPLPPLPQVLAPWLLTDSAALFVSMSARTAPSATDGELWVDYLSSMSQRVMLRRVLIRPAAQCSLPPFDTAAAPPPLRLSPPAPPPPPSASTGSPPSPGPFGGAGVSTGVVISSTTSAAAAATGAPFAISTPNPPPAPSLPPLPCDDVMEPLLQLVPGPATRLSAPNVSFWAFLRDVTQGTIPPGSLTGGVSATVRHLLLSAVDTVLTVFPPPPGRQRPVGQPANEVIRSPTLLLGRRPQPRLIDLVGVVAAFAVSPQPGLRAALTLRDVVLLNLPAANGCWVNDTGAECATGPSRSLAASTRQYQGFSWPLSPTSPQRVDWPQPPSPAAESPDPEPVLSQGLPLSLTNFTSCVWTIRFDRVASAAAASAASASAVASSTAVPAVATGAAAAAGVATAAPDDDGYSVAAFAAAGEGRAGLPYIYLDSVVLVVPHPEVALLARVFRSPSPPAATDAALAAQLALFRASSRVSTTLLEDGTSLPYKQYNDTTATATVTSLTFRRFIWCGLTGNNVTLTSRLPPVQTNLTLRIKSLELPVLYDDQYDSDLRPAPAALPAAAPAAQPEQRVDGGAAAPASSAPPRPPAPPPPPSLPSEREPVPLADGAAGSSGSGVSRPAGPVLSSECGYGSLGSIRNTSNCNSKTGDNNGSSTDSKTTTTPTTTAFTTPPTTTASSRSAPAGVGGSSRISTPVFIAVLTVCAVTLVALTAVAVAVWRCYRPNATTTEESEISLGDAPVAPGRPAPGPASPTAAVTASNVLASAATVTATATATAAVASFEMASGLRAAVGAATAERPAASEGGLDLNV